MIRKTESLIKTIFEPFITLWSAPIDNHKLDISEIKENNKITNTWFFGNLIVGRKP